MNRRFRSKLVRRDRRAFTLIELVVISALVGVIMILLGRFFLNYWSSYRESSARMRLHRDMVTLTYWIRKDLSAMPQRPGNVDLHRTGNDFAFIATDDPNDSADWNTNATDNGLDQYRYVVSGNKVTRTWDRLGTMSAIPHDIMLEAIEPSRGDSVEVRITLTTVEGDTLGRSNFDATFGNFERTESVRRVEMTIYFYKQPTGFFSKGRPVIVERGDIESVTLYRRSG